LRGLNRDHLSDELQFLCQKFVIIGVGGSFGRHDGLTSISFTSHVLFLGEEGAGAFEVGHGQLGKHDLSYACMLYRAGFVVRFCVDGMWSAKTVFRSPDIREHRSVHAQPAWESQHELGRELGAANADQEFNLVAADHWGQVGALAGEVTSCHFV
jgi:hypothetical protein